MTVPQLSPRTTKNLCATICLGRWQMRKPSLPASRFCVLRQPETMSPPVVGKSKLSMLALPSSMSRAPLTGTVCSFSPNTMFAYNSRSALGGTPCAVQHPREPATSRFAGGKQTLTAVVKFVATCCSSFLAFSPPLRQAGAQHSALSPRAGHRPRDGAGRPREASSRSASFRAAAVAGPPLTSQDHH